jgi:adenosylhomocysteine nucleosidase
MTEDQSRLVVMACEAFLQRDMDVTGLGFARGRTPYEEIPAAIVFPTPFIDLPRANCGTGDSFGTGVDAIDCDVIDMEAYALAKACHVENTAFACAKSVSDGADHTAAADWQANLHRAADHFLHLYLQLP